ncbi:SagB family peptide dehydrogenase [Trueperella pyogenes]|uniref:SagB family peptide dehydrogenase n=1 Tax=Trueperella pyogenes TaxID=1661 RepID=UPI00345D90F9
MTTDSKDVFMPSVASAYIRNVLCRAQIPLDPEDHKTNWEDKPRTHKVYSGAKTVRFHGGFSTNDMTLEQVLIDGKLARSRSYDLDSLIELLWAAYGIKLRKLHIYRNEGVSHIHEYLRPVWGRGASSGGSLYSLEVYLVCAGEQGLVPGIYNWNSNRNELQRLVVGNVTDRVRQTLPDPVEDATSFLIITVKIWKNSFKYSTFAPHVTATDIGTACSSWALWARSRGLDFKPQLWFDEPALNELLSLDSDLESAVAVVPLNFGVDRISAGWTSNVQRKESERSVNLLRWDRNELVVREMREAGQGSMPAAHDNPSRKSGHQVMETIELPAPTPLDMTLVDTLRTRRSTFGMLSNSVGPMTQQDLHAMLLAGLRANEGVDFAGLAPHETIGAWVLVNYVEGLKPGAYRYQGGKLELMLEGTLYDFQQRTYYLKNYDFGSTAAIITLTGWPDHLMNQMGPRGLRIQDALLGAACQYIYLAAASLKLGCGAALGFAYDAYAELFDTARVESKDPEDEWPMLIMAVGPEQLDIAEVQMELEPA